MTDEFTFKRMDSCVRVFNDHGQYVGSIRYCHRLHDYILDIGLMTFMSDMKRKTLKAIFLKMQEYADNDPDVQG
jgi:hypothetical protein